MITILHADEWSLSERSKTPRFAYVVLLNIHQTGTVYNNDTRQ